MERAGMLTYIFPHTRHFLAVLVLRLRWVCLCLDIKYFIKYKITGSFILKIPRQVAAGGVILPTLRTLVLWFEDIEQTGGVLAPAVTGEE